MSYVEVAVDLLDEEHRGSSRFVFVESHGGNSRFFV